METFTVNADAPIFFISFFVLPEPTIRRRFSVSACVYTLLLYTNRQFQNAFRFDFDYFG